MQDQMTQLTEERDRLRLQVQADEREIANMQEQIRQLQDCEIELRKIHESRYWKLRTAGWNLRDRLMPADSKRRLVLELGKKFCRHPVAFLKRVDIRHIKTFRDGMKSGSILNTAERLDNYLGGGDIQMTRPDQLPLEEYDTIDRVPPLHVPTSGRPLVSIIIPVYNQFAYTYACLKSIAMNTGDVPYEVLIADDCSGDLTKDMEQKISGVKVIRNKENLRFLLNCNHAAESAKGQYILFLNNDTQVQRNWLRPLIDLMESAEDIGLVGSKLIYPDGRLQEAGGILWKDGSAWNYGNRSDPNKSEFNYVKEADYISGAAIMIRADLWRELGGFDETFAPAYCEDTDLAFRVRKAGYRVMYQPTSVVIHFEGISNGTDTSYGQKAYQVANTKKFYEKWKDVLEKEHMPNAENVFLARDRSLRKKTLLFVDHYAPQPDKDAGSRTVLAYLQMFVKAGFNVKFLGDNFMRQEPYTSQLQQMGIEVLYGNWYRAHWKEWIAENADSFDYAFLNRPHIAVNYIDVLREKTKAHILYYGHDLHFLRFGREYALTGKKELLKEAESWKEKELSLMRKADLTAYPSETEIEEIRKIDPTIRAVAITPYFFDPVPEADYHLSDREDLFFVGGYKHTPNIDAAQWIAGEIMPKLRELRPGIRIHIAGSNMPKEVSDLQNDEILIEGLLTEEQLEHFYRHSRLNLIPLRYGAGVKGKVVESMRYGLPVITTACGAEGIPDAEGILQIAETAEEIAKRIAELYDDEAKLQEISAAGIRHANEHYTEERAKRILDSVYHFDHPMKEEAGRT